MPTIELNRFWHTVKVFGVGFSQSIALIIMALCLVVCAEPAIAENGREKPRIGNGDLLRISVIGDEMTMRILSGEFRVGSDGTIDYPVLGSILAANKLPEEIGQLIHASLGEQIRLSMPPTVSVAQYAPVYLIGSVQRAGSYPFQPNMTILDLVLASGGLPTPADTEARFLAATQEAVDLQIMKFALLVERARLVAETENREFDAGAIQDPLGGKAMAIVENEKARFDTRRRAEMAKTKVYEAQRQTYDREIESLRKSIELHDEEVELVKEEMKIQQTLTDKGLAPRSGISEMKREFVNMQRQALEYRTGLYRAEQNRLAAEQKLIETRIATDAETLDRLHAVEIELSRTSQRLEIAEKTLLSANRHVNAVQNLFGQVPTYTILRQVNKTYQATVADERAMLQRGDIVRVDFSTSETRDITKITEHSSSKSK